MIKIGITGGIGSGKTTVCKVWQSLGAYVINADDLAKDIMLHNASVKQAIIKAFGNESYQQDGSLDRKYLAEQAFEKGRVEKLNAIVHPVIPKEVEQLMATAEKKGVALLVYEAALLLQNLRPDNLDYVVLVLADEQERIKRVQKREGKNSQTIKNRVNKQQDFKQLTHLADIIIENDDTLHALKKKAEQLYYKFLNIKAG